MQNELSHPQLKKYQSFERSKMSVNRDNPVLTNDHQKDLLMSLYWGCSGALNAVYLTAIELNLFEIIAKAGPDAEISAKEIASHLPTQNEGAPLVLDRMLQLLASYSILKSKTLVHGDNLDGDGHATTRLYGLTPMSKCLVPDEEGISMIPPLFLAKDKAIQDSWDYLKDAVLEGGIPFNKAHGMHLFEYLGSNIRLNMGFNESMLVKTTLSMREIFETYKGFEDLKEVVDVGGGIGITLNIIVSKYPLIRGINYDLPHVISTAPAYPGVEHVEGDMFQFIPKVEVILLKHILHDWSDEHCLKILKNCWDALPESGKVIIVDMIIPESPETNLSSRIGFTSDLFMLLLTPGGKERTQKEFEALAKGAGFASSKLVCRTSQFGILEFYKN